MGSPFEVTPSSDTIRTEANRGTVTFTIRNITDRTLQCRFDLDVVPPAKQEWLKVDRVQRTFLAGQVDSVSVSLEAPSEAEGNHSFRIIPVSLARPDEDYTKGPYISFALAKPAIPVVVDDGFKIKWWMILIAALVVLGIAGGIAAYVMRDKGMPELTGKPIAEVEAYLKEKGYTIKRRAFQRSEEPQGTVIAQKPPEGEAIPEDKAVELTISGTGFVAVPPVKDMTLAEALAVLRSNGLDSTEHIAVSDGTAAAGTVVDQNPRAGVQVTSGSQVILSVRK